MFRLRAAAVALLLVAVGSGTPPTRGSVEAAGAQPAAGRELLDRYCVTCHNERTQAGALSLDTLDLADVSANTDLLEKIVRKLRKGQMPPEGRPRPDAAVLDRFVGGLETALDRVAGERPNPGRVASRRLNRLEYVSAI